MFNMLNIKLFERVDEGSNESNNPAFARSKHSFAKPPN